jgi:hypothetical protein
VEPALKMRRKITTPGSRDRGGDRAQVSGLTAGLSRVCEIYIMENQRGNFLITIPLLLLLLSACGSGLSTVSVSSEETGELKTYEIVTLLPADAIQSIDNPRFYTAEEADQEYDPEELIIGVDFNGDVRAYSIAVLSSREIVNDVVDGRPIAVTW